MTNINCYVCNTPITSENEADEHIIINAAGGRLKSKELICLKCNSEFGENIDSELAKQMNNAANMLMVRRHRGQPQPMIGDQKSTGKKYLLEPGGKPKLTKPTISKTIEGKISIIARDKKELRKILEGFAKKNPHFDVSEVMKSAQWKKEYLNEGLHFSNEFGGVGVFRAVCKCATNYYIYKGGDASQIKHLIPYIKGDLGLEVVWMHYQENIYDLAPDESSHILHLVGNQKNKTLYCYVDYFNTYKYLVLLNDNYSGLDISETYSYDLMNIEPIEMDISLSYDRETLLNFFSNKDTKLSERFKKSFDHIMTLGLKIQNDFQRREILERAIQNSLGKYPEGIPITEEMLNEAINEIVKDIVPYLARKMK